MRAEWEMQHPRCVEVRRQIGELEKHREELRARRKQIL